MTNTSVFSPPAKQKETKYTALCYQVASKKKVLGFNYSTACRNRQTIFKVHDQSQVVVPNKNISEYIYIQHATPIVYVTALLGSVELPVTKRPTNTFLS